MKKISIITINLNNKIGLKDSIESVINQNIENDIEFIVIDGLSSDGSSDVIELYKNSIDKYISEDDAGIFDAMNKGIDLSTGEYIYFLNSGDRFASDNVLKIAIEAMNKKANQYDIYCGDVATFRFGEYLGLADLNPWICHQGAFVKNKVMKSYKFDSNYYVFGDLDLWTRMNKDGKFKYSQLNKIIANMELDGIGTNPRFIFKRLKDKLYYAKKNGNYLGLALSFIIGVVGFLVFKVFGEKFYYHFFLKIIPKIKKAKQLPFWSLRVVFRKIFSLATYPIYKLILKDFGLGSFIHPFASIGNHNLLSIGKNVEINHNVTIWGDSVIIGDHSQINPNTAVYGNVKIGEGVMIAPNCMVAGGNHKFNDISIPIRFSGSTSIGITIGDNVWIGANCVIVDGVTIEEGSVIGAGSVVIKNIAKNSVCIGNPSKVISVRK